ncbi:hypothetical protein [Aquimarina sp. AU474]|uniref:hypothetical protein n=1 Tax=Aquimarina sp. AU474 TaxID=2108529 RepID=UPI000D699533|nr:hypothetical protein [Aquimarina sp. AU474]
MHKILSKIKKKIDPNLIIAIGVLIASFSALFVYIKQANIMSKQTEILLEQTKANSWPRLSVDTDINWLDQKLESLRIKVHNKGTGPAIIEGVKVSYNGEHTQNWSDLLSKTQLPDSISNSMSNSSIYNSVLSANENFYWVQFKNDPELAKWMYDKRSKITIEICYKSVFDDYWLLTISGENGFNTTQKLDTKQCPILAHEMFKT